MSKECIRNCPLLAEISNDMENDNMIAAIGPIHTDMLVGDENTGVNRLLTVCEASYDCPGPRVEPVEVIKGFFTKRVEIEDQQVCGLGEDYWAQ